MWHKEVPTVCHASGPTGKSQCRCERHTEQAWGPWSCCAFAGPGSGSWSGTRKGPRPWVQGSARGSEIAHRTCPVDESSLPCVWQLIQTYFLRLRCCWHKFYRYSPIHSIIYSLTNSYSLCSLSTAIPGNNSGFLEQWKHLICHPTATPASFPGSLSLLTLHPTCLDQSPPLVLSHPQTSHCRALRLRAAEEENVM